MVRLGEVYMYGWIVLGSSFHSPYRCIFLLLSAHDSSCTQTPCHMLYASNQNAFDNQRFAIRRAYITR